MRIAIDTGGTFTDCLFHHRGKLEILKVFSTPEDPAQAIAQALEQSRLRATRPRGTPGKRSDLGHLLHGTTVGTNALLERRGGRIALVTTAGFEDVLVIGRQARPRLYDFFVTCPPALVPTARRLGVEERIAPDGGVVKPLERAAIDRLVRALARMRPEGVAVCLLFSFANPTHERRLAKALAQLSRKLGMSTSVSHQILPEFREYERTATVTVNAYLLPVMGRYLSQIERLMKARSTHRGLRGAGRVQVMQSSGGTISARLAAQQPVRTILSGPAGGVVGAGYVAELAGLKQVISFDMGGTSTDVALLARELPLTTEGVVGGLPIAVPMLDIHSVGAGGGSIAWFDRGGALRVGPQSAGADPGPICYGRGQEPTVTDAHLVLGRLDSERFLGGEWRLDAERARRYMVRASRRHGFRSVEEFASGILAVANATMERAVRVISVERGHDPREFALVAFGGAGGLHAGALAAALRIPLVVVPKFPGALSALGMLRSEVVKDYSKTVLLPVEIRNPSAARVASRLEREFARLERTARAELGREGYPPPRQRLLTQLDLRYRGQGYELTLPYQRRSHPAVLVQAFHRAHQQRYGYSDPGRPVEVVTVRLRALGVTSKPVLQRGGWAKPAARAAHYKRAPVWFQGRRLSTDFYWRERLRPGNRIRGPAVIAEYSATTVVLPGWKLRVDAYESLLLEP